ncbi:MAG: hypothetical protein P0120_01990 [Nitrospira sp.]|nr:hypothetical protein [Nitrospira sp.]
MGRNSFDRILVFRHTLYCYCGIRDEFGYLEDLPVSQNRGPLAGQVSGAFSNVAMHFFAFAIHWWSQGLRLGLGAESQATS